MADTEITLTGLPWRDTAVSVFLAERIKGREGRVPPGDPLRSIPATDLVDGEVTVTVAAVQASVVTGDEADDNAIRWTAQDAGADGNDTTVALIDPPGNNVALAVDVTGTDIVVTLATDGSSVVTTTADLLKTAVAADVDANALVAVADEGASDGSGVVAAVAETALAYGGDALAAGDYVAVAPVTVPLPSSFHVEDDEQTVYRQRAFSVSA